MERSNVDDLLIEMISPKVKEIETRFSNGEGLSSEDINTLLLKSQYNHINHLDQKLDQVTDSVVQLEKKFQGLEGKFQVLEIELNGRMDKFEANLNGRMDKFEANLNGRMDKLEAQLNGRVDTFEKNIEVKISQAINTNMRWSIGMIALIVTVLKLADMVIK